MLEIDFRIEQDGRARCSVRAADWLPQNGAWSDVPCLSGTNFREPLELFHALCGRPKKIPSREVTGFRSRKTGGGIICRVAVE
jgi:hypothetical protein